MKTAGDIASCFHSNAVRNWPVW